MRANEPFRESRFATTHTICIHGQEITFDAIAEDFVFTDEQGEPEASLFTYTYLRKGTAGEGRPVLFAWDGGPGGSCLPEQLYFFGPWRLPDGAFGAPYALEDNPHCLLDACDIVLVDPVGTGFGRLLNSEKAAKYYGTIGDTEAMADFIEAWLTHYHRWNSPLYLCGTSYGSIRCARVVEELNGGAFHKNGRQRSIAVDGVILVGNTTWLPTQDIAAEDNSAASVLPAGTIPTVLLMPTFAAANWYHNADHQGETLDACCERAWNWAWAKLEPVLSGKRIADETEKAALAAEMSDITGIGVETLLAMDLQISQSEMFAAMLLADKGLDIGIYDSRMTLCQNDKIGVPDPAADDPAMSVQTVPQMAAGNSLLKDKLGITFGRQLIDVNYGINAQWDYSTPEMLVPEIPKRDHNQCLAAAMRRNERMKLLVATGAYDMCTWSGLNRYTAENSGFPRERTEVRLYPSGHTAFAGEDAAALFERDVRNMLK